MFRGPFFSGHGVEHITLINTYNMEQIDSLNNIKSI